MIDGNRVLAVIAARGSSKGLPRKNVLEAGGKPLIAWSIEAASGSRLIDRFLLSSDDDEIVRVAQRHGCGCPFKRPAALAADTAAVEDAVIHVLEKVDEAYDYVVLLQATSPLRSAADIDGAIERCHGSGMPACVTVTESAKSPFWMFRIGADGNLVPLFGPPSSRRRQDVPTAYVPNGAVYVARVPWFQENRTFYGEKTVAHVMPPERSLDVDSAWDLEMVRALLVSRASQPRNDAIPQAGRDA